MVARLGAALTVALLSACGYREIWKDAAAARVTDIGLFCDSDETRDASIAWFAEVKMKRVP